MKKFSKSYLLIFIALLAGILSGLFHIKWLIDSAHAAAHLFMNFLKLVSVPIVFLSIVSTLTGMKSLQEMKTLGKKVFSYTLLTTLIAAFVALILFVLIEPAKGTLASGSFSSPVQDGTYTHFLLNLIPENLMKAFLENNVVGVAFVGFIFGIACLKLPRDNLQTIHHFFSSLFKAVLKMTEGIILVMPIGIWAFTALLVIEFQQNLGYYHQLALFLTCVVGANLFQALFVLPLLLKLKKISPIKTFKGAFPALMTAFFSKSSNATLPITLECAEQGLHISPRVAQFSLPLCTVINMNACAAFIFTTVLFVSTCHGFTFTPFELVMWVVLATIAAIGNAGVPMGCFFLSTTFLVAMNVPVATMGLILPFYAFLDMLETAVNVWSDLCITVITDQELSSSKSLIFSR